MRNLLLLLIIILTFCLSFYGCGDKDEYYNVPTQYYPVYKEGDTLVYKCGNKYDTFYFSSKSIFDNEIDKRYHYQEIGYYIINKNYPQLYEPTPCRIYLLTSSITITWLNCYNQFDYKEIPSLSNISINNITYYNIYELSNNKTDTSHYYIKKLFFNYKYWVVRYIKTDSTIWDLIQH